MPLRQGRKSASQTPSLKSERIYGSKKNPKGSASSSKSAKNITFSDKTIKALQNKLDEFKEKHKGKKNITLGDLKAVYRRGSGAYSSSHRPGISRNGWAMARVNKFLLKAGGTKVKAAYVQDDDLMKMHLGGDMSKHLAPNGKPSNLTHEQWHLVRTPEFKAWFGDFENNPEEASKVIDENGEPMVVYRGNLINQEELGYTFNLGQNFLKKESGNTFGFFFTNNIDIAKKYMLVDHFDEIKGGSLTKVFIKSNKILDLKDFDLKISQNSFVQGLIQKGIIFDNELEKRILDFDLDTYKYWGNNVFDYFDVFPELKNLFIKNGFSSVIFYEMSRSYIKYEVYVAFDSNQIKLADGTNTTFDSSNPDIRYYGGGDIDEIVYHGSPNKFENFELEKVGTTIGRLTGGYGIYFTNKEEVAKEYALKGGSFIQAKLKVSNFFDLDENITDVDKILEQVEQDKRFTENDVDNLKSDFLGTSDYGYEVATNRKLHEWLSDTLDEQQVSEFIEKLGYDGTTFIDKWDKDARNYVIFNPTDVEIIDIEQLAKGGTFNDKELLKKYKQGKGIGFTAIAHLKAKGLIPREDGTKRKSDKYKEQGGDIEKLAKGKKLKIGGGDCYYIAGQFAMDNIFSPKKIDYVGTPYLVHAEVQGQGHIAHIRYGHAWVEDDENVYDFSNGRELVIPKPLYYAIGQISTDNPKKYQKYTFAEARQKMVQTKHYGCWDLDVEYREGGEVVTDDEEDLYDMIQYQKLQKNFKDGGSINQDVTCINCGWHWNTKDSEEFDKYVCHNCGFDNTLYYSDLNDDIMSKLKTPKTLSEISKIHNVSEEVLAQQLEKGIEAEMEHTTDKKIAETIALHHIEEMPDYYDRLKEMESGSNIIKSEYKQNEMKKVRFVGDDRAFWYVISETPEYYIGVIDEKLENWKNADQVTKVQYFEDYLPKSDMEIFEKTTDQLKEGGVVVGKRHSESDENGSGERFLVKSTGQVVELEGGEGVLNKESMTSNKTYEFQGKKMNARQIASFLNHKYGGVEFAEGGDVKSVCGCKSYYHGGELPSATLDNLEGGEAVVTVKTMESKEKYQFQGMTITPRKILSQINADFGGKKFDEGGTIDISDYKLQNEIKLANMYQFVQKLLYHKRNIM